MAFSEVVTAVLRMEAGQYQSEARKSARSTKDIGDAAQDAGRKGGRALDTIKGTAIGVGTAVAGAFAVDKVMDFVGGTIDAAADLGESINAVDVVFGNGAQTIHDYGKTAATAVGLAQNEFNSLATNTGALLTNFGFAQQAAANESINLTERAADMASVFNTDVGDALFAVQAALRGESEPIRRFGVSLDVASVKAKAVEMGLAATTAEVDKHAQAQAAIALIYEQTNAVAGDFANTSGSLANQQRIMAAELENAKAEMGQALLPVMLNLVEVARDLMPAFTDIVGAVFELVGALGPLISLLGDVLGPILIGVADTLGVVGDAAGTLAALLGDEAAQAAWALDGALEHLNTAADRGQQTAAAYADGLLHLATKGHLSAEAMAELGQGIEFVGAEQFNAIRAALEHAEAQGIAADQTDVLKDALVREGMALIAAGEDADVVRGIMADLGVELPDTAAGLEDVGAAGGAAADGMGDAEEGAASLEEQLLAARDAQESLSDVLRAAADPAFAAVQAYQQYQQTLQAVDEDGERTAEEQLELAEAILKAQGALDAFTAGGVTQAAEAIATALGISRDEAAALLEELGILDGTTVTSLVDVQFRASGSASARDAVASGQGFTTGNISFFQHGGEHAAGEPIIVGEAGRELWVPKEAGRVFPLPQGGPSPAMGVAMANASGAMMGTGNVDNSQHTVIHRTLEVTFVNSQLANDPMEGVRNALALDAMESVA